MSNVRMIRTEVGLVSIPVERAVYCKSCKMISSSIQPRCGLCGSEQIVRLGPLFKDPEDPGPAPVVELAA